MTLPSLKDIIARRKLHMCLECGKCSASCPRLLTGKEYSPRLLAAKVVAEPEDEAYIENAVWECLTCGLCEERCPSGVEFSSFILEMRTILAETKGLKGYRAHDGALHSWMRIMTSPQLVQNRLDWLEFEHLRTSAQGKIAYFTGCAPYFEVFFAGIKADSLSITRDSILLLNFLDIDPVLLPNERCCGHDLLWIGDAGNFEALCRLNYEEFKKAGVEEVIVSCPECYQVFSRFMPEVIPGFDLKVTLLLDLLDREVKKGGISFKPLDRVVTYQDPCRLGRMAGRCDEPRELLRLIPDLNLVEMQASGRSAMCCGNNAFINCDAYSKRIQIERLKEAKATKADILATACPKCRIHLTCAMRDPYRGESLAMEIRDIVSILAESIEWGQREKPLNSRKKASPPLKVE
ncbi:MAG: (Fe-S)-binding protein [Pseudomonadota bacterium]